MIFNFLMKIFSCPFCVQPNFGVTYLSPDSEEYQKQYEILVKAKERHETDSEKLLSQGSTPGRKRRNVISYTDSHIVTSGNLNKYSKKKKIFFI